MRVLTDYAAELGRARPRKLAPATIARKVAAIRSFLRFTLGPTKVPDVSLAPRRPKLLPDTPKTAEVEAALDALVGDGPLPLRNRALVELVYSAGLRSAEAVGLDLADVDFDREQLHVRGKGGKERIVPLGEEAGHLVAQYLHEARPQLAAGAENALFLSATRQAARHVDPAPRVCASPSPAPCVRNPSARRRRRPAHDPGPPRPQLALDHAALQPRRRPPPAPRLRQGAPPLLTARPEPDRVDLSGDCPRTSSVRAMSLRRSGTCLS